MNTSLTRTERPRRADTGADFESCRLVAGLVYRWTGIVIPDHHFPLLSLELRKLGYDGTASAGVSRIVNEDKAAIDALLRHVTNPETYVFRHFGHFQLLRELALKRAAAGEPFVAVSAGCSTGEEAWSIAAVLTDAYQLLRSHVKVYGWDINPDRVRKGIVGKYSRWSARKGFHGYEKYFSDSGTHWSVGEALRPAVRFEAFNLRTTPIPEGLRADVVFCRNVSIYWDADTTREILGRLTGVLKPGGMLFSGPSDPVPLNSAVWQCEIVNGCPVYQRRAERAASPVRGMESPVASEVPPTVSPGSAPVARPARIRRPIVPAAKKPQAVTVARKAPAPVAKSENRPAVNDWLTVVQRLADSGRYEDALAYLDVHTQPHDPPAILWRGIVSLNLERYQDSVGHFQACVFLDPDDSSMRRWYATALVAAGRHADAEREYRNADSLVA